jgi:membrane fusion protein, heavy metal efflux system
MATLILGILVGLALRRLVLIGQPSLVKGSATTPFNERPADLRTAAEIVLVVLLASALLAPSAFAGPGHDHGDGGPANMAEHAAGNTPRKMPDGTVFVPKPSQRLLQVRTAPAMEEAAARTRELIGTVVPDPASFGQVQAPMDGRIEVGDRGISFPGQKVQAGEVLALVSPTIPLADLGTMQQLRAEVEGKLIIAESKLARLTRIANVVAQREIDDTKAEVNALREQKRVLAPKDVEKIAIQAPVSGVISLANVRAGQVVSARDTLFEIVDPEKLWIEAIGADLHGDGDILAGQALDSQGHWIKLDYNGRSPTLRQQSRPFLFRVTDAHSGLAIGAPVKVIVQTKDQVKGIIVPDAAVVRASNGLEHVWVKTAPEQFRAYAVRTAQLDGARTLIFAGVDVGARIVIGAAELINQIR